MQDEKEKAINETIKMWKAQKDSAAKLRGLLKKAYLPGEAIQQLAEAFGFLSFIQDMSNSQVKILEEELKNAKQKVKIASPADISATKA